MISLISSRRPEAWSLGSRAEFDPQDQEIDQGNGKPQDLRYAVLQKRGLRLNEHPPKWSILEPRDMSPGSGEVQGGGFRREFGCCSWKSLGSGLNIKMKLLAQPAWLSG